MAAFFQELLKAQLYKKTQGRIVRQWTFAAVIVVLFGGLWRLSITLMTQEPWIQYGIPALLGAIAVWCTYRLVNFPKFADFLIQVEAEMRKVSWPSRAELINSSIVVIIVMFFLAGLLFGYDLLIKYLIELVGIVGKSLFQSIGIFH